MAKATRNRLGRGLDALLAPPDEIMTSGSSSINEIELDRIEPNPGQPRSIFEEESLEELAQSLRTYGVIQPIILKEKGDGHYLIIAGERRYRAAERIGLDKIPAYIKTAEDENIAELALIENIQREDLNPLEEASAIQRLIDEFHYTHEQAAQAIGRSRSATSNLLRLLNLADTVQTMLLAGDIEMGHARALLSLDRAEQILMAHLVVQRRLSVRETERLVSQKLEENKGLAKANQKRAADAVTDRDVARLRERIADHLNTTVEIISKANGRGKLVIHFSSNDAFSGLLERLRLDTVTQE